MKIEEANYAKARAKLEDASSDAAFHDYQLFKCRQHGELGKDGSLRGTGEQLKRANARVALAKLKERATWTPFIASIT